MNTSDDIIAEYCGLIQNNTYMGLFQLDFFYNTDYGLNVHSRINDNYSSTASFPLNKEQIFFIQLNFCFRLLKSGLIPFSEMERLRKVFRFSMPSD